MIKLSIWRWRDGPELTRWIQRNHKSPYEGRREAAGSETEEDVLRETERRGRGKKIGR